MITKCWGFGCGAFITTGERFCIVCERREDYENIKFVCWNRR